MGSMITSNTSAWAPSAPASGVIPNAEDAPALRSRTNHPTATRAFMYYATNDCALLLDVTSHRAASP